jgi:hypothetical protein
LDVFVLLVFSIYSKNHSSNTSEKGAGKVR